MKALGIVVVGMAISLGCGSTVENTSASKCDAGAGDSGTNSAVDSGADAALPLPEAGLVPPAPVIQCGGNIGALSLQLPCQLGQGPIYEVECSVSGGKVNFLLPFRPDSVVLNQSLPFTAPLTPDSGTAVGTTQYALTGLHGQITFYQMDFSKRAFLGRLTDTHFEFAPSDNGATVDCPLDDGLIWAVPGNFE